MQASNGYQPTDLAQTAFTVFHQVAGLGSPDWQLCTSSEAWTEAALAALRMCDVDEDNEAEVSARGLAATMYRRFCFADGVEAKDFADLASRQQLAWEAAGRHLANLIGSDGSLSMSDLEKGWDKWADKKLQTS